MIIRRTLVSLFAVTVAMMLGSSARAQSNPTAQPKNYYRFLMSLPETRNGVALMQRYGAVQRSINYLQHIPIPGPPIVRQLATLYSQRTRVFVNIQSNINALLARQTVLQKQYQSLEAQKEALLASGRVLRARQVAMQQGNVSNVLGSVQRQVVTERGVATPVR
jgi:hypothetical protein